MDTINEIINRIMTTQFAAELLIAAVVTTIIGGLLRYFGKQVKAAALWTGGCVKRAPRAGWAIVTAVFRVATWPLRTVCRFVARPFKREVPMSSSLYTERDTGQKSWAERNKTGGVEQGLSSAAHSMRKFGKAAENMSAMMCKATSGFPTTIIEKGLPPEQERHMTINEIRQWHEMYLNQPVKADESEGHRKKRYYPMTDAESEILINETRGEPTFLDFIYKNADVEVSGAKTFIYPRSRAARDRLRKEVELMMIGGHAKSPLSLNARDSEVILKAMSDDLALREFVLRCCSLETHPPEVTPYSAADRHELMAHANQVLINLPDQISFHKSRRRRQQRW